MATYRKWHGRELNWRAPNGFAEKLFRRMIFQNRSLGTDYTPLADKYLVRDYVARKIGAEYLATHYWQGTDPTQIPFGQLPDKYVIKTTHASRQVIRVNGSVDPAATIAKLQEWLGHNYYWEGREHQYFGITPRVVIEEYLDDGLDGGPLDYRFWCFDGKTAVIQIGNNRHDINPFYDTDWNLLDLHYRDRGWTTVPKPVNLDAMLAIAGALSADFDFVRVDLYNLSGRICFGELTFTPAAGRLSLKPESWDAKLGEKWILPA